MHGASGSPAPPGWRGRPHREAIDGADGPPRHSDAQEGRPQRAFEPQTCRDLACGATRTRRLRVGGAPGARLGRRLSGRGGDRALRPEDQDAAFGPRAAAIEGVAIPGPHTTGSVEDLELRGEARTKAGGKPCLDTLTGPLDPGNARIRRIAAKHRAHEPDPGATAT